MGGAVVVILIQTNRAWLVCGAGSDLKRLGGSLGAFVVVLYVPLFGGSMSARVFTLKKSVEVSQVGRPRNLTPAHV